LGLLQTPEISQLLVGSKGEQDGGGFTADPDNHLFIFLDSQTQELAQAVTGFIG